jgi:hypothetical protein
VAAPNGASGFPPHPAESSWVSLARSLEVRDLPPTSAYGSVPRGRAVLTYIAMSKLRVKSFLPGPFEIIEMMG